MHSTGCYPLLAVRFCHGHRSAPDKRVLNRGLSQYNDVQFLVDSAFKQGKKPPSRSLRGTLWRFALRYPRLARALLQPPPNIFQLYWCYWLALDRSAPDPSMQRCPADLVAPARSAARALGASLGAPSDLSTGSTGCWPEQTSLFCGAEQTSWCC